MLNPWLQSVDVMDYSLLVGVDEQNHELVLGIIDFMRQYTWDKHLETWVKASGILGGPKNASPTARAIEKKLRKMEFGIRFGMAPEFSGVVSHSREALARSMKCREALARTME
ncbi:1-phosphatidylinositol-3-phosphate 5-kinase FAB1B, partial [Tanacetum coccineum]